MPPLIVMDGGMGHELQRRMNATGGLWSAQALIDAPALVAEVHRAYVQAGARIIITNTYSTIPSYLAKDGREHEYLGLAETACRIAREVADEFDGVIVAGSLPPLDESYRHDLVPADEIARPIYRALAEVMAPHVDVFLCETVSCVREGVNAVSQARAASAELPIWIAWTLGEAGEPTLRSGETVTEALRAVEDYGVAAFLFNCTTPQAIGGALAELKSLTDAPFGAYPNLLHIPDGWTLDNEVPTGRSEMSVDEFVGFARAWRAEGASIIGGCCGIGPDFIEALAEAAL